MQELTTFISNHPALFLAAIGVFILLMIVELARAKKNSFCLSPLKATQLMNHDNAVVIDTRSIELYRKGHVIDAVSIPAEELRTKPKKLEKFKSKPIILFCQTGLESQKIAALLLKEGYNAYAIAGGMRAWLDADMPLVKE